MRSMQGYIDLREVYRLRTKSEVDILLSGRYYLALTEYKGYNCYIINLIFEKNVVYHYHDYMFTFLNTDLHCTCLLINPRYSTANTI